MVATRHQLIGEGWTVAQIDAQLAARRWRRLNDAVVALHNGPLSTEQAQLAIYLSAQQPAALCGLTAAQMWGLRGFDSAAVHVVVCRGARVLPVPGVAVAVHESRRFSADDVFTRYSPARVSMTRAVIDAAVWTRSAHQASRIVAAAVQQRLASPGELLAELDGAGRVRHRRVLGLLLQDLDGGAQALSEAEFLRFCRRQGFPRPRMDVRSDETGRRRYLDAEFRARDGRVVRVEVDGGIHLSLSARAEDNRRDNAFVLRRLPVLRFASVDIYTDNREAIDQLRLALGLVSSTSGHSEMCC